jgi:hypothetical protein
VPDAEFEAAIEKRRSRVTVMTLLSGAEWSRWSDREIARRFAGV